MGFITDVRKYKEPAVGLYPADPNSDFRGGYIRESVARFAQIMNMKLDQKADKKGGRPDWKTCPVTRLMDFFDDEVVEVHDAYEKWANYKEFAEPLDPVELDRLAMELVKEFADTANFGLMVSDNIGVIGEHEVNDTGTCRRPPPGWSCSRYEGHSGPCAASAVEPCDRHVDCVKPNGHKSPCQTCDGAWLVNRKS